MPQGFGEEEGLGKANDDGDMVTGDFSWFRLARFYAGKQMYLYTSRGGSGH